MVTSTRQRMVAFALASAMSTSALADTGAKTAPTRLTETIKVGDVVTVTRVSGGRVRGAVTAVSDCAIRFLGSFGVQQLTLSEIKTIRRHRQGKPNPGATTMLDVANQCDEIGCAPAALAFVTVAALVQGVDDLAHPPKVVFRSTSRPNAPLTCDAVRRPSAVSASR
jgi:hypothetical protein